MLVVPRDEDRDTWRALRREAAQIEEALSARPAETESDFEAWLAGGSYLELETPLDPQAGILTLDLDDPAAPAVILAEGRQPIEVEPGAAIEPGPEGHPALMFGPASWAQLPSLALDTDTPFSIAMWIYMPEDEGGFTVASQYDPEDGSRGWSITIGGRQLFMRLSGDRPGPGRGASSARVGPINTKRMETGEWTHVVFTHDGSGERGGMHVYRNGERIEEEGSEFFAKAEGSILTDRPFYLGRGDVSGDGETRHFAGGGIADLRVFDRVLSVGEADVVSEWDALRRASSRKPTELSSDEREVLRRRFLSIEDAQHRRLVARRQEIDREWREIRRLGSITHVMQETPDSVAAAHVLHRGMYDQPRERVTAATPAVLPPMAESLPRNRLGLAMWLIDDANPLMGRVTVNRFWQQVFGVGLVATSEDFGAQGEPPSHPELLDFLALRFRESGWDTKSFFRELVTSATYRQAGTLTPEKIEHDADNRLLSRGPRFRMDAEMVRDYALAASGLLVRRIGGPSVKPYQPEGVWSTVAMPVSNTARYEPDSGEKLYRRSLYTFWKRAAPPPAMIIFNAPSREHSTVRRERTTRHCRHW